MPFKQRRNKPAWAQCFLLRSLVLCAGLIFFFIAATNAQTVDLIITPPSGCVPLHVDFLAQTSGGTVKSYKWDLDNGPNTQNSPVTGANYTIARTYNITLVVTFENGTVITKKDVVVVHPLPVANFMSPDTVGCTPLKVKFKDLSTTATGTITQWYWDLETIDSDIPNPEQTYPTGTYSIKLFVRNNWGCASDALVKENYIKVGPKPDINFTVAPLSTCKDSMTVAFTNSSTNAPNYTWDFGDSKTSNDIIPPPHFYNAPGTYTIKVKSVVAPGCEDEKTKVINIGSPKALTLVAPDTICENTPTNFIGTGSTGSTIRWVFTDKNQQRFGSPANYSFTAPGNYEALLIVTNTWGCSDTLRKKVVIKPGPKPAFTTDTARSCKIPFPVKFTDLTGGSGLSYTWNFGDGNTSTQLNPQHSYLNYGIYSVTLTVKDTTVVTGCAASIVKFDTIRILRPTITVKPDYTLKCSPPKPFTFVVTVNNNFLEPPVKFAWSYSDGTKDTTLTTDATHVFTKPGAHSVTVTAITNNGCTASATTAVSMDSICPTPPDSVVIPTYYCNPCYRVSLRDTVSNSTVLSWDFGDGTSIATGATNPTVHNFPDSSGYYKVTVRRKNNTTGVISTSFGFVLISCSTPTFTANKNVVCLNEEITFTPTGVDKGAVSYYYWNFGDGATRFVFNPVKPPYNDGSIKHPYNKLGLYNVTLSIIDTFGCSRTSLPVKINVVGPKPDFSSPIFTGCDTVLFASFKPTAELNGNIPLVKWQWTFGDATTLTTTADTSIPKRYTGYTVPVTNYTVTLKVTDSAGCTGEITKTNYIRLYKPKAAFYSPDTINCKNYAVRFFNQSNAVNATYTWRMGDGDIKTGFNITHTYPGDGDYNVMLIAKDENGCVDSISKPKYIRFVHTVAGMKIFGLDSCYPVRIRFQDSSEYAYSYAWDFGDKSNISPDKNPTRSYTKPGDYTVALIVTGPSGCKDTISRVIKIKGATGELQQGPLTGCKPFFANLKVTNAVNIDKFIWDFGDGSPVIPNPKDSVVIHPYTIAGKYLPNIIYRSPDGCTYSRRARDTIIVDSLQAMFDIGPKAICDSGFVNITNLSAVPSFSNITNYSWVFGNGQTGDVANPAPVFYNKTGIYNMQLAVESKYGCKDTMRIAPAVEISPRPKAGILGDSIICLIPGSKLQYKPFVTSADAIVERKWFVDGKLMSTDLDFENDYRVGGPHTIALDVKTNKGCSVQTSKIIYIDSINTAFTITAPKLCGDSSIATFINQTSSVSGATKYLWQFGDDSTGTLVSPTHMYIKPGKYSVKMEGTTAAGCKADISKPAVIEIFTRPILSIKSMDTICQRSILNFTGNISSQDSVTAILWKMNTSNAGNTPDMSWPFNQPGEFNISMNVRTMYGCDITIAKPIRVHPLPVPEASPDTIVCINSRVRLSAVDGVQYSWQPATTLINANTATPIAKPRFGLTQYVVTVVNKFGCVDKDTAIVQVDDSIFVRTVSPLTICRDSAIGLDATGNSGNYTWTPAIGLSSTTITNPVASPQQTTLYQIVAHTNNSCPNDTASVHVTVNPRPDVKAMADKYVTEAGKQVVLLAQRSNDVLLLQWTPSYKLVNPLKEMAFWRYPDTSTTFTVTVTNQYNCIDTAQVRVLVQCGDETIFVPNAFTPNKNGSNERFRPLDQYKNSPVIKQFSVFNRWGQRVYHVENMRAADIPGWDGTVGGTQQEPGTYVWLMQVDCAMGTGFKKGVVLLIK